ncbi:MAG TPA: MATE family efflux transporter [Oscillospiraceae bacterium]|nr:MATE family efflux transporter [Oscillospiraceae bacterium]HPS33938.1 MATE family efflux transporter [Oscillospiraceae bacterium]
MSCKSFVKRLFDPRCMVKPELVEGELPDAKTAYPTFIKLAMPAVVELMLISMISVADTAMVSSRGEAAITAVGLTGQPTMILLALFFALNVGVTAVIARRKGEQRQEDANTVLRMALMLAMVLGVIMTVVSIFFGRWFMMLSGAKEDTIADSTIYFQIVNAVLMFRAMTLAITSAQRGVGNTKISMRINITANAVNIVFNYLLINGHLGFPELGVAGAAIATSIGNMVGFGLAVASLLQKDGYLRLKPHQSWKINKEALSAIRKVSGNAVLEQMVLRFGFFTFARVVAELGTMVFATHQIGMQALNLSFTFADGLGVGATTLVGQYLGAKRPDISAVYGRVAQRIAMAGSLLILILFASCGKFWITLFSDEPDVIALGTLIMIIAGIAVPLQTSTVVSAGSLRGAGDTKFVAYTMLISVGIIRPLLGYVFALVLGWGLIGAWMSLLIDLSIRLTLTYRRFSSGKWSKIIV